MKLLATLVAGLLLAFAPTHASATGSHRDRDRGHENADRGDRDVEREHRDRPGRPEKPDGRPEGGGGMSEPPSQPEPAERAPVSRDRPARGDTGDQVRCRGVRTDASCAHAQSGGRSLIDAFISDLRKAVR